MPSKTKKPPRSPVIVEGRAIAKSWWGIKWNENLERYADYENRIGRGRSYVRSGAVLDLQIEPQSVTALVQGSRRAPYKVAIGIAPISEEKAKRITEKCAHRVETLEALVSGRFPEDMAELLSGEGAGLFPTPREIRFACSCPDWAHLCKHVAAALYGIGRRLDDDPLMLFMLRGFSAEALIRKSAEEKLKAMLKNAGSASSRAIEADKIADLFGLL